MPNSQFVFKTGCARSFRAIIAITTYFLLSPAFGQQQLSANELKQLKEEARLFSLTFAKDANKDILNERPAGVNPENIKTSTDCMANVMTTIIVDKVVNDSDPKEAFRNFRADPKRAFSSNTDEEKSKQLALCFILMLAPTNSQDVSDIIVDFEKLTKSQNIVRVKGFFVPLGEFNYLYEKAGALPFLLVATANLPREERKKLLTSCGRGCAVTFSGFAKTINGNKGLVATNLDKIH